MPEQTRDRDKEIQRLTEEQDIDAKTYRLQFRRQEIRETDLSPGQAEQYERKSCRLNPSREWNDDAVVRARSLIALGLQTSGADIRTIASVLGVAPRTVFRLLEGIPPEAKEYYARTCLA